jgi:hypothetical protein
MHLVQVLERLDDRVGILWVLVHNNGYIPTSADRRYWGAAFKMEARLGIQPAVYFYAGRANTEYGALAVAFHPTVEENNQCISVTPFDSGALVNFGRGALKLRGVGHGSTSLSARRAFFQAAVAEFASPWRDAAAWYLAAYFPQRDDYWRNQPYQADPEGIFALNAGEFVQWAIEVRIGEPVNFVRYAAAWTCKEQFWDLINSDPEWKRELTNPDIQAFLRLRVGPPGGSDHFDTELEQWIQLQIR